MSAPMTTPHLPGKFIWFEHVSPDIAKARAFYEPLFGWHVETMPMGEQSYPMILNGDHGIGGLRKREGDAPTHWLSHLSVTDVDLRHQAALRAGAKSLLAPTDFPPVGRGATIADPTGAVVSLWKSANGDRPDVIPAPVGDWVWNELWTPDADQALAFYEGVFGLGHERMSMGEQGTYLIVKSPDGQSRGGIFQAKDDSTPVMWLPYVHVADCDATAQRATELGARVFMPPASVPGVGRFAAMFDPQGAAVAFITPQPR